MLLDLVLTTSGNSNAVAATAIISTVTDASKYLPTPNTPTRATAPTATTSTTTDTTTVELLPVKKYCYLYKKNCYHTVVDDYNHITIHFIDCQGSNSRYLDS